LRNLMEKSIPLPGKDGKPVQVAPKELGILYPVLIFASKVYEEEIPLPGAAPEGTQAQHDDPDDNPRSLKVPRCDFKLQFIWKETPMDKRLEEKEKQQQNAGPEKPPATAGVAPAGVVR
jgi:hypothetical protein